MLISMDIDNLMVSIMEFDIFWIVNIFFINKERFIFSCIYIFDKNI